MRLMSVNSLWFVTSITLNALGNSFMIMSNLGSAPWTTAGENLVFVLPFSIGVCIIILHFFAILLSSFMKIKFSTGMVIKSITLAVASGLFIDLFMYLHQMVYIPSDLGIRYLYLFIGLNLIAVAICIYFQISSIYLPADFLLKAFRKLVSNYTIATIL